MNAIFVASGPGIKRGVKLASIRNLDVAPTVAQLIRLRNEEHRRPCPDRDSGLRAPCYTEKVRKFPLGSPKQCLS